MNDGVMPLPRRTRLQISDDPLGKEIVYLPLRVKSVFPASSIKALQKRARNRNFSWTTEDGSLTVQARENCWNLAFRMVTPPHSVITVLLSPDETDTVPRGLLIE